jgi:hypothetical protein
MHIAGMGWFTWLQFSQWMIPATVDEISIQTRRTKYITIAGKNIIK